MTSQKDKLIATVLECIPYVIVGVCLTIGFLLGGKPTFSNHSLKNVSHTNVSDTHP
ncbi:MAG TPA: hypothetical protein VF412_03345 [Bdellovibrio sp.]|uniref:hypothetical protein n=1 Tax=Bdellovibrio sp. TaxID=28201 RepID=UPI002F180BA6